MAINYRDAIDDTHLDAAVRRVLDALACEPGASADDLAMVIVREIFCSCVTVEPDASPQHPASIHVAVAAEIVARVQRTAPATAKADRRVEIASQDSFPASDPPSWIYAR